MARRTPLDDETKSLRILVAGRVNDATLAFTTGELAETGPNNRHSSDVPKNVDIDETKSTSNGLSMVTTAKFAKGDSHSSTAALTRPVNENRENQNR